MVEYMYPPTRFSSFARSKQGIYKEIFFKILISQCPIISAKVPRKLGIISPNTSL